MSLLDNLLKNQSLGSLAGMVAKNPQLLQAAASLLSTKDSSVGSSEGLFGVVKALESQGLGDVVASWIGSGQNQPVAPHQVESAFGEDTLSAFARKAGIARGEAPSALASILPALIDQLTPEGRAPEANNLEGLLGGLFR